jgi:putative NADH-flavin reductase
MTSIAVLGATGNLGQHVARQVLARGCSLSVAVRSRSRLAPEVSERAQVTDNDLSSAKPEELAAFAEGQDAFVSCAGAVTEGEGFVTLVDKLVSALETIQRDRRPVSWFLAGAALLPLDASGRLGVDLPKVRDTYWPHRSTTSACSALLSTGDFSVQARWLINQPSVCSVSVSRSKAFPLRYLRSPDRCLQFWPFRCLP